LHSKQPEFIASERKFVLSEFRAGSFFLSAFFAAKESGKLYFDKRKAEK
jgi:hypothetical protein